MAKKKAASTPAKKPATKTTAKKPAAKKTAGAAPKKLTKTQLMNKLAERCEMTKKDVENLYAALTDVIREELQTGAGEITLPGLLKIKKRIRKGKPAGERPVPGQKGVTKWYPATEDKTVARALPLKGLKDMVD